MNIIVGGVRACERASERATFYYVLLTYIGPESLSTSCIAVYTVCASIAIHIHAQYA